MAKAYNLNFDQGANVEFQILVQNSTSLPMDLTGYTASATFRKHYESTNSHSFVCNAHANGLVVMTMNSAISANIAGGRYVYDTFIHSADGTDTKIQEGILTVYPSVTR